MNLPQVQQYVSEAGALLNEVDEAKNAIDQLTALIRTADDMKDHQRELALSNQRAGFQKAYEGLTKNLLQQTQRSDVERARELVTDILVRIEAAKKSYQQWRALVAEFEYVSSLDEFAPEPAEGQQPQGMTRRLAEAELDKAKARAEKRVELAAQVVPSRPVILL